MVCERECLWKTVDKTLRQHYIMVVACKKRYLILKRFKDVNGGPNQILNVVGMLYYYNIPKTPHFYVFLRYWKTLFDRKSNVMLMLI